MLYVEPAPNLGGAYFALRYAPERILVRVVDGWIVVAFPDDETSEIWGAW